MLFVIYLCIILNSKLFLAYILIKTTGGHKYIWTNSDSGTFTQFNLLIIARLLFNLLIHILVLLLCVFDILYLRLAFFCDYFYGSQPFWLEVIVGKNLTIII